MLKTIKSLFVMGIVAVAALVLLAGSTNADTITMTVSNLDWNAAMWGSGPSAPTSGNDYVTANVGTTNAGLVRLSANGSSSTFLGDNLEVVSGTRGLLKNEDSTSTINGDLTISGGLVDHGPNDTEDGRSGTLDVQNLIITGSGSELGVGRSSKSFTIDGTLTGSGDLKISGVNKDPATMSILGINDYTGAITFGADDDKLTLDFGTVNYAFSNSFTIVDANSVLNVKSGQTLTFNEGDLVDPNGTVDPGTYTTADLGSYYTGGGTIQVIPEPSGFLLAAIGLIGLALLRRRK